VNGGAKLQRQPVNVEEAVVTAQWLLTNGYNIDLGLGQINSANLTRVGLSVTDAFDPCKNLKAAGTIFNNSYQTAMQQYPEDQALQVALSTYNTGNFVQGFKNGYVQKVLSNMPEKAQPQATESAITAVQPIPLVNATRKATVADFAKPKSVQTQPATVTVEKPTVPNKAPSAFVYQMASNETNTPMEAKPADLEKPTQQPEPTINVYTKGNAQSVMVYQ
jgi:type IV secretion system protein VirB1